MKGAPKHGTWSRLATELRNPRSRELDRLSIDKIVRLILDEDRRAILAARRRAHDIARGAHLLARVLEGDGTVVFVGAGTSGRLGVLEAAECPPTFGVSPRRLRAVMAGGKSAVFLSQEGAEDNARMGALAAKGLKAGDLLVGISASSVTPFVRAALRAAQSRGAATILVTCVKSTGPKRVADVVIEMATGPEVLAGSTRMKAGSATKAVLNAITTAGMIRLGKTYGNLMVDLRPTSAKLRDRSTRIVAAIAGVKARTAARLLRAARGEVKTAIVMKHFSIAPEEARRLLSASRGHLRSALSSSAPEGGGRGMRRKRRAKTLALPSHF